MNPAPAPAPFLAPEPAEVPPLGWFEHLRLAEAPDCETLAILDRAADALCELHRKWGRVEDFDRHLHGLALAGLDAARDAVRAALPNVARQLALSDHRAARDEAADAADAEMAGRADPHPPHARVALDLS